jgi:hypothetical protein
MFFSGCVPHNSQYIFSKKENSLSFQLSPDNERVWLANQYPMSQKQIKTINRCNSLLIMIPGISSGNISESRQFLNHIRAAGHYKQAIFYDWKTGTLFRKTMLPSITQQAAERLIEICKIFQENKSDKEKTIDLIAHSAGTVIINKAAAEIMNTKSPVRFRNILFLGTPLYVNTSLDNLKSVSTIVLNVHSAFDKINRNINQQLGRLAELNSDHYKNLQIDYSISGRIIRHDVFLASNPENWINYSNYLSQGSWPEPIQVTVDKNFKVESLHRQTMWLKDHPAEQHKYSLKLLQELLMHKDYKIKYYGVIITGILQRNKFAPTLKNILKDKAAPVYLRKEIYQALGNFEDGRQILFLKDLRKRDALCKEEIRDILRALKRKRIRPIR